MPGLHVGKDESDLFTFNRAEHSGKTDEVTGFCPEAAFCLRLEADIILIQLILTHLKQVSCS